MEKKFTWVFLFVFVLTQSPGVFADQGVVTIVQFEKLQKTVQGLESNYQKDIAEMKDKINQLEEENKNLRGELTDQGEAWREIKASGTPADISEVTDGLKIDFAATSIIQSLISDGNTEGGENKTTDSTYTVDLSFEKSFEHGTAFALVEAGEGVGLDGDELGTFSTLNRDAGPSSSGSALEVTELWYEHYFLDDTATLTAGKIDASNYVDTNELANDETSQFLSTAFRDNPALEFPDGNAFGIRFAYAPSELVEFDTGIIDDNADFEDIGDEIFAFAQVNIKPEFMERPGNYRFFGWFDHGPHTELDNAAALEPINYGFGLSFDQEVTDTIGLFTRLGWADPDVSTVNWHWSAGGQLFGSHWGRKDDVLGAAISQNIPSDDVGAADSNEGQLEVYYNYAVTDYLTISPHYQLVWNPMGVGSSSEGEEGPLSIISLRSQLNFG